jgi:hypothetical protein
LPARAISEWPYCPFCGASLAPLRLVDALSGRGWNEEEISTLMDECGFEPPLAPGEDPADPRPAGPKAARPDPADQ